MLLEQLIFKSDIHIENNIVKKCWERIVKIAFF